MQDRRREIGDHVGAEEDAGLDGGVAAKGVDEAQDGGDAVTGLGNKDGIADHRVKLTEPAISSKNVL